MSRGTSAGPARIETKTVKGLEEGRVFVLGDGLGDDGVELGDGADEDFDDAGQALGAEGQGLDEGLVAGEIDSRSHLLHQFVATVLAANAVLIEERLEERRIDPLEDQQRGPALKQFGDDRLIELASEQVEEEREILLQKASQLQRDALAFLDLRATQLSQFRQFARLGSVGLEGAECVSMMHQERDQQLGIGGVALAAGGVQGLAKAGGLLGIDGINREPADLDQGGDERSLRGLDDEAQLAPDVLLVEHFGPSRDGLGLVVERAVLRRGSFGIDEANGMGLVSPVDADEHGPQRWIGCDERRRFGSG